MKRKEPASEKAVAFGGNTKMGQAVEQQICVTGIVAR